MKLLFKQAIKSVFSNKIFTSIMLIIIFISGATYTLFQSTANSFQNSYNNLVDKGNLHDAIIKQNYEVEGSYTLNYDPNNIKKGTQWSVDVTYDATTNNNDYYKYLKKFGAPNVGVVTIATTSWSVNNPAPSTDAEKLAYFQKIINEVIAQQVAIINKNVVGGKSIDFAKAMTDIYQKDLTTDNTQSLVIANSQTAFKAVTSNTIDPANDFLDGFAKTADDKIPYDNNIHNVNKLVMYDGTSSFTENQTYSQMQKQLEYEAAIANIPITSTNIDRSKGFRWSAQDSVSKTVTVTDPSSYEAVVSPSYANSNDKISISPNTFLNLYKKYPGMSNPTDFINKLVLDKSLQEEYKNNYMMIDQTPYFIIGIGTTPDFAYPIVDAAHPTPNINTQGIVFMNRRGYERIYDAFRTAPNENYISLKFKSGVSKNRQNEIKAQINIIAREGQSALSKFGISYSGNIPKMSWPSNINIVTGYNQGNDNILLAEQRVSFLGKLKQALGTLSYITTIMLLIFIGSIVILVFSSLIETKRKILATLLALGYSKWKIALSFGTVSLLIAALPSFVGYMTGHFIQYAFINLFSNYWTIPIYGEAFSWMSLVITVVVPFVSVFLLIFLILLWQLRHNVANMLNNNVVKYDFAPSILRYFKFFSVKSKYSISLIINNFWRLIIIAISGIVSISAIIVGLSTIGRASYAYDATSSLSNYTYKLDLYTPTDGGGTYNRVNYSELYNLLGSASPTYPKLPEPADDSRLNKPHWHIPSTIDASLANFPTLDNDAKYLPYIDYYLRYKFQTKALLNVDVGGMNPWDTAKKLMPDNQKNIANKNEVNLMGDQSKWPTPHDATNPNYINFFKNKLQNPEVPGTYAYTISYQNILANDSDETYTYISTELSSNNTINDYHITGYKPDTKFLNIPNDLTNTLEKHKNDSDVPILINKYISKDLKLNVGDTVAMDIKNKANRFDTQSSDKRTFKVQGIVNTYDDNGIFTLQDIANKVTGIDKIPQVANAPPNNYFNGVFTKESNSALLNTLPLYSPSGVYLATDIVTNSWESILKKIIGDPKLWTDKSVTTNQEFISKYGATPLVGAFDNINWKSINQYTFKNISTLSSYLIIIIQLISIIISIIFAIIISSLFVDANKKKIATLWTIGYRKKEISKIFLSTYILPVFIATAVAIPISLAIISIMRLLVMNFGHILIPFAMTWWMPLIAIGIIGIIFSLSILTAIFSLKGDTALKAFVEE